MYVHMHIRDKQRESKHENSQGKIDKWSDVLVSVMQVIQQLIRCFQNVILYSHITLYVRPIRKCLSMFSYFVELHGFQTFRPLYTFRPKTKNKLGDSPPWSILGEYNL
jgi:hypothetical protein